MKIESVPESLSKEQYMQLVEAFGAVGFDTVELRSIEFRMDGIYASIKARSSDGKHLFEASRDKLAEHRIYVPVRWDDVGENRPADR